MMMNHRKTLAALCLTVFGWAFLLTGCSKLLHGGEASAPSLPDSSLQEPEPTLSSALPEDDVPQGEFNPLTGEHTLSASAVGKRPIAVMIDNNKAALPQYGLSKADICYEVLAEGGITRIMALFADAQSIPTVGPVRSARDYFVALATPYNAIYVHFGGSPMGYSVIQSWNVNDIDGITQFKDCHKTERSFACGEIFPARLIARRVQSGKMRKKQLPRQLSKRADIVHKPT